MPALREIKDRMNSIRSTMKITNAMYMISSTKLNNAKASLAETEPYFYALQKIMSTILKNLPEDEFDHPYLEKRENVLEKHICKAVICITADKGLAGSYNHNIIKMTEQILQAEGDSRLYVVGEAGRQYFTHKRVPIDEHFLYTAQQPTLPRARSIASRMLELFEDKEIDEVYIVYTKMLTATSFEPDVLQLLPLFRLNKNVVVAQHERKDNMLDNFVLAPSPDELLDNFVPDYLAGFIYSALVESYCAEHFARMQAMDSANKNGEELLSQLSTQYNRTRQAKITQEITEVAAGARARKQQLERKKSKEGSVIQ